jgi:hypothetical protein
MCSGGFSELRKQRQSSGVAFGWRVVNGALRDITYIEGVVNNATKRPECTCLPGGVQEMYSDTLSHLLSDCAPLCGDRFGMFLCIRTCVYVYMYVCVRTYVRTYVCVCVCVCVCE